LLLVTPREVCNPGEPRFSAERPTRASDIVGTYRILTAHRARPLGTFYSDTEFDLTRLERLKPAIVEIGRARIHPDYGGGTVRAYLRLGAWIGGEPAWGPDFNTVDLFVFLPIARVEARYV